MKKLKVKKGTLTYLRKKGLDLCCSNERCKKPFLIGDIIYRITRLYCCKECAEIKYFNYEKGRNKEELVKEDEELDTFFKEMENKIELRKFVLETYNIQCDKCGNIIPNKTSFYRGKVKQEKVTRNISIRFINICQECVKLLDTNEFTIIED